MPDDAALERLSAILNRWHALFYAAQEQRKYNVAVKKAEAAISTLRSELPIIKSHHQKAAERGDLFAQWQANAVGCLAAAIDADPHRVTHGEQLPETVYGWQWLADVLPSDFAAAMTSTNGTPPKISENGPLVRFAVAVIPILTGEHPEASTVKRRLLEHRSTVASGAHPPARPSP
jgi:hypothetical protein